jgi:hypothetical protein
VTIPAAARVTPGHGEITTGAIADLSADRVLLLSLVGGLSVDIAAVPATTSTQLTITNAGSVSLPALREDNDGAAREVSLAPGTTVLGLSLEGERGQLHLQILPPERDVGNAIALFVWVQRSAADGRLRAVAQAICSPLETRSV